MKPGVLEKDGIYFLEANNFARNNLYYLHWGATYVCDSPYEVLRESLDACILFYILEGNLNFNYRGQYFTAQKNQIVLLSGKHANHYYAQEKVKFTWFHFYGNATEDYIEFLYKSKGALFSIEASLQSEPFVKELMKILRNGVNNEHMASFYMQGIFSHLAKREKDINENCIMKKACQYLDQHYKDIILLRELAKQFNFSKAHFSREFKKEIGSSPHQYLLNRRLLIAKQLLTSTKLTVETIASECGFNSTSHFIRAFKNVMNITPKQFREMPF